MIDLPTRREHETWDLGPFTVRVGYCPPPDAGRVERLAREMWTTVQSHYGNPDWDHYSASSEVKDVYRAMARAALAMAEAERPPVVEVFFDQRGKVGTEINHFLHDAGVLISKVLQGKEVP